MLPHDDGYEDEKGTLVVGAVERILPELMPSAPAREAVKYEVTHFNATLWIDSPFVQPPSPETDKAWHDLVDNSNIILPAAEMIKANITSIPVPKQPGMYFSELGMFHEIHCLKRLRQYMYPEYYFPNLSEEELRLNRMHNGKSSRALFEPSSSDLLTSSFQIIASRCLDKV
ncbi:hypothetical protein LTR85_001447 [Meristemomyces frigidus]|nr:hypothetical protein LTR85_001447 [Meristemomyces frigidus]